MTDIKFAIIDKPVTEFNVGRFCLSEYDCIQQGINFAGYERGIADAAEAFSRNSAAPTTLEPVAFGHPNTAITGRELRLIMVELEIPSTAQYPQLWEPLVLQSDAAAIIAKLTRERESWEKLFGEVALSLKCLPSCFVDDNSHVLRVAKEAMEQLAAAQRESKSVAMALCRWKCGSISGDELAAELFAVFASDPSIEATRGKEGGV